MRDSLVRRAAEEFKQGRYLAALDLYRKLAERLGERFFRANIMLCERMLRGQGQQNVTRSELRATKVACVMDEFTFHCYDPECQLLPLTPGQAIEELQGFEPDLLFIESAWQGKDGLWSRKIGSLSQELRNIVQWCKEHQVPTVFWNKEDPVHFETFLTTAQQFDFVFTTDIDCIARYKAALGHDRVYLLPFACQPKTHNPIELYPRKDAFCFAGAYYVRYPERTRDLETYVAEFPKFKPLEIFDRNFGKEDVNYQFPAEYRPYIVGTLPFNEIDKAYKGYRYSINLNSIKQSQTMFARRVFELLGSNTITVSNFSRGVRLMFGDLVIASDSGKEIVERLRAMDAEGERKLSLGGLRKVMQEHTYGHRLAYVVRKALGWRLVDELPPVVVVAKADSQAELQQLLSSFRAQRYADRRLIVVTDGEWRAEGVLQSEPVTLLTPKAAGESFMGDLVPEDAWMATMLADDYYGPHYLTDLVLATHYSDAAVVGKGEHYEWTDQGIHLRGRDRAYRPIEHLPVRASLLRWDSVPREQTLVEWLRRAPEQTWRHACLAIDPFNYCTYGHKVPALATIQREVDDLNVGQGLSVAELFAAAESIGPGDFDETGMPKWGAPRLRELLGEISRPDLSIEYKDKSLTVRSTLQDGKHEYLYAKDELPIASFPVQGVLETYLDVTPGLDIQYVFVFLNSAKERISHVIHTSNRNHSAAVPDGAAYVRFGLRVSGGGETEIKVLQWGHRTLEQAKLLSRSETLLLTNHYPSYKDLYRNGFVHSRVRSYMERGVAVDVFRLHANEATTYHEFQNVDVVTGAQAALHKLLESGRYKTVLVHFLTPDMWEVLRHYDALKVIVWVHGAEVQPWHRRDYNYQTDQERAKAVRESDLRMEFWRGLLNPMPSNLKFVFVSRYFAEEVFEDVGFRVPETSYAIIHNPIDTDLFSYVPKPAVQRKRVLSIRPYASRKYANDLSVKAIQLLSGKPCFGDMEFRMIGDGKLFDETLEPLKQFENVVIERRFLTHAEIASLHKEYGVCLTPTRMDAQGVSRDEAMSSGLVPITNAVAAIPEFVDAACGELTGAEDAAGLAEAMANLYEDPDRFQRLSRAAAERVRAQSSVNSVVRKELALFAEGWVS